MDGPGWGAEPQLGKSRCHILSCHPGRRATRADPRPMYHRAPCSRRDGSRLSASLRPGWHL